MGITNEELQKKVLKQRDAENKGWEIASYGVDNRDLGAMRNALEIIATAKLKQESYIDVWFDGKYIDK